MIPYSLPDCADGVVSNLRFGLKQAEWLTWQGIQMIELRLGFAQWLNGRHNKAFRIFN